MKYLYIKIYKNNIKLLLKTNKYKYNKIKMKRIHFKI